jgi:hypothetical protein
MISPYRIESISLPKEVKNLVISENWDDLDKIFISYTQKDGFLFQILSKYITFSEIEFIISIRDSQNPYEEDGIWHDDGSRMLAFSLSLTLETNLEGGILEIRNKNNPHECYQLKTPNYGEMIVFKTGQEGYEHKINKLTKGRRIIIAGWCT